MLYHWLLWPSSGVDESSATSGPPFKRFKFLMQRIEDTKAATSVVVIRGPYDELADYFLHYKDAAAAVGKDGNSISYWQSKTTQNKFPFLVPLALDILNVPASEAYVERIFSVCGDLTTGKRNRAKES